MASFLSNVVTDINAGKRIASYAMNAPVVVTGAEVSNFGTEANDIVAMFKVPVSTFILMVLYSFDKNYGAGDGRIELACAKIGADGDVGEQLALIKTRDIAAATAVPASLLVSPVNKTLLKIITDANKAEALGNDQYVYLTLKTTQVFAAAANCVSKLFATTASTAGTPLEAISY